MGEGYRKENEDWAEYLARRKREIEERRRDNAEGKTCSECGGEIGERVFRYEPLLQSGYDGTKYRRRPTLDVDPICESCAPAWVPRLMTVKYQLPECSHKAPCEACGREVFYVSASESPGGRVFCSENCKVEHKARRVGPRERTCEVCGSEFVAKRSDARTCSPACRQKLYRKRLQVSTAGSASGS